MCLLFISTPYPCLLQSGIKFTNEPPQGVKASLRQCDPGPGGHLQPPAVEADAVHSGLPPHHCAGEEEVWSPGMKHILRVQPV